MAQSAKAKGISIAEEFQLFVGAKPQARFSTLQDIDAKRHTEIDIFAGEMVRMGKSKRSCKVSSMLRPIWLKALLHTDKTQ